MINSVIGNETPVIAATRQPKMLALAARVRSIDRSISRRARDAIAAV
jgi:hypothetical protein